MTPAHAEAAGVVRSLIATYEEKRDLVALGAYKTGTDAAMDRAVRAQNDLRRFLQQPANEAIPVRRNDHRAHANPAPIRWLKFEWSARPNGQRLPEVTA